MKRDRIYAILGLLLCCLTQFTLQAQEKVFAQYFDIPVNSPEGTEVIGRIHLERNKDILTQPIPKGYHFEIVEQDEQSPHLPSVNCSIERRAQSTEYIHCSD